MNSSRAAGFPAVCLLFLLFLGAGACRGDGLERTILRIKGLEIDVEVARTEEERAHGLMYREKMGPAEGMIFIFKEDRRLSFWMKNTLIPLSIAYISADGTIREIYDMEPGSLDPVESIRSVRYALEMPRGFFEDHGITPGDRIIFEEDFVP